MHLLLRRSQRDDGLVWSSITFLVDARLDLDEAESEFFTRYRLYDVVVYDSQARVEYGESAAESYEASSKAAEKVAIFPEVHELPISLGKAFSTFWHFGSGLFSSFASALSLRITLQSLADGQHIETDSLEESLAIAEAIRNSVQYLADYLEIALTYDGREELNEY